MNRYSGVWAFGLRRPSGNTGKPIPVKGIVENKQIRTIKVVEET